MLGTSTYIILGMGVRGQDLQLSVVIFLPTVSRFILAIGRKILVKERDLIFNFNILFFQRGTLFMFASFTILSRIDAHDRCLFFK